MKHILGSLGLILALTAAPAVAGRSRLSYGATLEVAA